MTITSFKVSKKDWLNHRLYASFLLHGSFGNVFGNDFV